MNTRDRLAEALRAHRVRSVVLGDGECACGWFGSPFSQHQTDALLPLVEQIAAERAAEELRAARSPMLELADQIEAGAFSLDAERRGFLASAVRACAGGRPGEPCR